MVNKIEGNRFEAELCEMFADRGWWSHNMAQNQIGQPADVIAVKNNVAVLIDCKLCANNRFPLSRIECNQEGAMTLWEERGNAYCYFALKLADDSIYMISFDELSLKQLYHVKSLSEQDIRHCGVTFRDWADWMESTVC